MSLPRLRAFDAAVAHRGFGAGARALGMTQPAVSAHVASLEAEFGVRLLDRATGEATALGARLAEITHDVFAREEEAMALLRSAAGLGSGLLRVGGDAPVHVMPMLAALRSRHPSVRVRVLTGNSARALEWLRAGEVDVAVAADVPDSEGLEAVPFRSQDLAVVVRTDHPVAARKTVQLRRLATETIVAREEGSRTRAALRDAADAAGVRLDAAVEVDGREAVIAAVAAGLGIGVVAEHEMIDDPRLVMVDIRDPTVTVTEYLVCRSGARADPLVGALFDAALARETR